MGVAAKASGDDRVVVWPDGAQVVADRVVPCLTLGECAHPPAAEHVAVEQQSRGRRCPLDARDAGPQRVARIGGLHRARLSGPLERECVPDLVVDPETVLERRLQGRGLLPQLGRSPDIPVAFEQFGDTKLRPYT